MKTGVKAIQQAKKDPETKKVFESLKKETQQKKIGVGHYKRARKSPKDWYKEFVTIKATDESVWAVNKFPEITIEGEKKERLKKAIKKFTDTDNDDLTDDIIDDTNEA